jgi:Patatin-like phospholipase
MVLQMKIQRKSVSRWLQYMYFLRFPIIGWVTLPVLCFLDAYSGADAITRGIMTLSRMWQAFYVGFFVPALGMTIFICAKNIVRNGDDRFSSRAPAVLRLFLRGQNTRATWYGLVFTQVPTVLTLTYVAYTTIREGESASFRAGYWRLWVGYALGLLLAVVFWYLVSFFYIWLHPVPPPPEDSHLEVVIGDAVQEPGHSFGDVPTVSFSSFLQSGHDTRDKSHEIEVPHIETPGIPHADREKPGCVTVPLLPTPCRMVLWAQNAYQPNYAKLTEALTGKFLVLTCAGYAKDRDGAIWPLHLLSIVALTAFLMLYFFLYPLIAPVYFSSGRLEAVIAILIYAGCVYGARTEKGMESIGWMFTAVKTLIVFLLLSLLVWDYLTREVRLETAFPVLASLLVIFIFFQWFFSGVSFFLDRYRIPVLTTVLALIFLPKVLPINQDHYFEVLETEKLTTIDTPSLAIEDRVSNGDEPYIIVTATGGGIRAAEWTAQVMTQLDKRFGEDKTLGLNNYLFHDHLLLASGVSGGSVGLMPYLLEYTADKPFVGDPDFEARLTEAPGCTSLEAVAWGLEYYDLQRLLLTYRPSWLESKRAPDRTWALTQALNRNLRAKDDGCRTNNLAWPKGMLDGQSLTLKGAAGLLQSKKMPAFTFNTTVAETGGRFLLSNYLVPPVSQMEIVKTDFMPAESFLQAYTQESQCDVAQVKKNCYLDIELATAARLSATFPIVSSATRIPKEYAATASHFLDGGYFDNDGTSSVIEFLYSALQERTQASSTPANPAPATDSAPVARSVRPLKRLRILLVEIRDGDDMNPTKNVDDWNHQVGRDLETGASQPKPWTVFNQLTSPLEGLWNAGHVSTTRRNRRELCLLERTYYDRTQINLEIHHVVLGIPPEPEPRKPDHFKTPPLNWKLTANQEKYLHDWATTPDKPTQNMIADAIDWVSKRLPKQLNGKEAVMKDAGYPACEIDDQTYMRR